MRSWLCKLWHDESGSLLITQWAFIATILILGILCAATAARGRLQPYSEQEDFEAVSVTVSGSNPRAD